jgi:hypothetical protein
VNFSFQRKPAAPSPPFWRPWMVRKNTALAIIIWAASMITYLAIWGQSDSLREAIATSLALLLASTIGSYIFGAVWDDQSSRRAEIDAMAIQQGIPPVQQGGATVVQQNNQQPADPQPPPGYAG